MSNRAELLKRLVEFRTPAKPVLDELQSFGWDWDQEPLVVLIASQFRAVFSRFLNGEIDARQLEEWADNLESREDVGFDPQQEGILKDLLFRIANPTLNEPLTAGLIEGLQSGL